MYNTANKVEQSPQKAGRYEVAVEKKMFFGNYKPRILKVYKRGESLYMSYWYIDAKVPKNEFELMINDYAQSISKTEFDVCNRDVKYTFKVGKQNHVEGVVNEINALIRKHY